ncbi:Hsp20/alpha crystallin family protein [uncultured Brachyspira sp.]|uniref:Hsp20/alpha crystallin family protein n=1 Tax=uncultured Brachyspira sp. TaxID=221953 RepID=UPI00259B3B00|nr:Hsp20/alpha crystallin family protein [uncultured Brachyspira sp.]
MSRRIFLPALNSMLDDFRCLDNSMFYNRMSDYKIEEDDKNYFIEMDMPGVKKEDLEVGVKENILSIYAERKKEDKTENKESVVVSKYEQSFNISAKGIDVDNIQANLDRGVLKITLPKKEEVKFEKKIEIA